MKDKSNKHQRSVCPAELIALTGSLLGAAILNQVLFWTDKGKGHKGLLNKQLLQGNDDQALGWIYKSAASLSEDLGFRGGKITTIGRELNKLVKMGVLMKVKGAYSNTRDYRINIPNLIKQLGPDDASILLEYSVFEGIESIVQYEQLIVQNEQLIVQNEQFNTVHTTDHTSEHTKKELKTRMNSSNESEEPGLKENKKSLELEAKALLEAAYVDHMPRDFSKMDDNEYMAVGRHMLGDKLKLLGYVGDSLKNFDTFQYVTQYVEEQLSWSRKLGGGIHSRLKLLANYIAAMTTQVFEYQYFLFQLATDPYMPMSNCTLTKYDQSVDNLITQLIELTFKADPTTPKHSVWSAFTQFLNQWGSDRKPQPTDTVEGFLKYSKVVRGFGSYLESEAYTMNQL